MVGLARLASALAFLFRGRLQPLDSAMIPLYPVFSAMSHVARYRLSSRPGCGPLSCPLKLRYMHLDRFAIADPATWDRLSRALN